MYVECKCVQFNKMPSYNHAILPLVFFFKDYRSMFLMFLNFLASER